MIIIILCLINLLRISKIYKVLIMLSSNEEKLHQLIINNLETLEQSILTAQETDNIIYQALAKEFNHYLDSSSYEQYSDCDKNTNIDDWEITSQKKIWDEKRNNKKDSDRYPIYFTLSPKERTNHKFFLSTLLEKADPIDGKIINCGIYFTFNRKFFDFKNTKESLNYLLNKYNQHSIFKSNGFEFVINDYIEYGIYIPFTLDEKEVISDYPSLQQSLTPLTDILKIITSKDVMDAFDEIAFELTEHYNK